MSSLYRKSVPLILSIILLLNLSGCGSASSQTSATAGKLKVSVTFNAMAEFVKAVGGDKVVISTIIPDGTEPHDFEPKAGDLTGLSSAQVFVYNGFGMEAWADKAVKAAGNAKLTVIEASAGATPIQSLVSSESGKQGQPDPHLWLSLKGAKIEVQNIEKGLVQADPANKDYYEANSRAFQSALDELFQTYQNKFAAAPRKDFVTGHAAFAYFCRDFGLKQNSVEDVFAEGEPSAKQLTELVDYCKKNKVTTIFAEDMASPAVSKTLADEVGAKVETIHTVESAENNLSYLDRMKDNLAKIYASLS